MNAAALFIDGKLDRLLANHRAKNRCFQLVSVQDGGSSWTVRYMSGEPFAPLAGLTKEGMQSPVIAIAILLIFIGLFAFFAVLFRLT